MLPMSVAEELFSFYPVNEQAIYYINDELKRYNVIFNNYIDNGIHIIINFNWVYNGKLKIIKLTKQFELILNNFLKLQLSNFTDVLETIYFIWKLEVSKYCDYII